MVERRKIFAYTPIDHRAFSAFQIDEIKKGTDANEALKKVTGTYGRVTAEQGAVKYIDPRHE